MKIVKVCASREQALCMCNLWLRMVNYQFDKWNPVRDSTSPQDWGKTLKWYYFYRFKVIVGGIQAETQTTSGGSETPSGRQRSQLRSQEVKSTKWLIIEWSNCIVQLLLVLHKCKLQCKVNTVYHIWYISQVVELHCYVPNVVANAYNVWVPTEPPNAVVSTAGAYTTLVLLITNTPCSLQQ
jgi:hypothetical protein